MFSSLGEDHIPNFSYFYYCYFVSVFYSFSSIKFSEPISLDADLFCLLNVKLELNFFASASFIYLVGGNVDQTEVIEVLYL